MNFTLHIACFYLWAIVCSIHRKNSGINHAVSPAPYRTRVFCDNGTRRPRIYPSGGILHKSMLSYFSGAVYM